jgi:hypothetical protein
MELVIKEKIETPRNSFNLVLEYSNRDDQLTTESIIFLLGMENKLKEMIEVIRNAIYNNYDKIWEIPNFMKYFEFQDVNSIYSKEEMEEYDRLKIIQKHSEMDIILWDYTTCSGEIPLEVSYFEVYYYDKFGVKYKVEVI